MYYSGIWITDKFGIWVVESSQIFKLSIIKTTIQIVDKIFPHSDSSQLTGYFWASEKQDHFVFYSDNYMNYDVNCSTDSLNANIYESLSCGLWLICDLRFAIQVMARITD